MTDEPEAPPAPPKLAPEAVALRAQPARAIRFRRGVIIAVAAFGSASVTGVAWLALQPRIARQMTQQTDVSQPAAQTAADALERAPATYGDIPKLGPPLPGDLGRPILRAQERQVEPAPPPPPSEADSEAARRQQRLAELKAARESGLMIQLQDAARGKTSAAPASPEPATSRAAPSDQVGQVPPIAPAGRGSPNPDQNAHQLTRASSPNMVLAGSVIAASLITGLNSDLPGMVTAQVTEHLYDTATGRILLVPQGTRLIGKYDNVVAFGQRRALVVWQRLILPDGSSLSLDDMPATDPSGYAGLSDKVDFHTWSLLKGVAIATLLGVGTELTISGESDLVQALRESAQSNGARAGDRITQRNLDIQPTITIRPGAPVRVLVTRDLVLTPWQGNEG